MKLNKRFPKNVYNETNSYIDIFKNIYDGIIYYKDKYGNLVPIFQGEASIYVQDGTLTGDRTLTGAAHYLHFNGLSNFTVGTSGDINLNPGGEVAIADTKSITVDNPTGSVVAIKCRTTPTVNIAFVGVGPMQPPTTLNINAPEGVTIDSDNGGGGTSQTTIKNGSAGLEINKGLAFYTGTGNDIAAINLGVDKTLVTKEWVAATYPGTVTSVGTAGTVNGLTLTGGPITSSGTITLGGTLAINNDDWSGTALSIANGGTGQSTQQAAINALTGSGSNGDLLTLSGGNAQWVTPSFAASSLYTASGTVPTTVVATLTDTLRFATGTVTIDDLSINGAYKFPTTVVPADNGKALTYNSGTGLLEFTTVGTGNTLYNGNDTVGAGRNATLTDTLTWTDGSIRRITNSMNVVEVTQESDFGAPLAGNITLSNDTTYIVRGEVTCVNTLRVRGDGTSIIGLNRNLDKLTYTGTGTLIDILDRDFTLKDIWLSSTISGSLLIRALNVSSGYNTGRSKVLEIVNCQIRNCFDVMDIDGFDLVDISNTLFFYVEAPTIGCRFRDTSKLEISSCELIRWFDEDNLGLSSWNIALAYLAGDKVERLGSFYEALAGNTGVQPELNPGTWALTGYSAASMIELQNNNLASFGAVNINGCIVHPQGTQNGIDIGTGSTTGFGTISSNAFVSNGLTTGEVFLPIATGAPDYSQTATYNYDVFANQGISNSIAYGGFYVGAASGFDTDTSPGGWLQVAYPSTPTASNLQRFTFASPTVPRVGGTAQGGILTYTGLKNIFVTITCTVVYNDTGGGNNAFEFGIAKNKTSPTFTPETPSILSLLIGGGAYNAATIVYTDTVVNGDDFQLVVQNISSADDIEIISTQFLIKE